MLPIPITLPSDKVAQLHENWQAAKATSDQFLVVTFVFVGEGSDTFIAFEGDCKVAHSAGATPYSTVIGHCGRPLECLTLSSREMVQVIGNLNAFAWPWQLVNTPDELQAVYGIPYEVTYE